MVRPGGGGRFQPGDHSMDLSSEPRKAGTFGRGGFTFCCPDSSFPSKSCTFNVLRNLRNKRRKAERIWPPAFLLEGKNWRPPSADVMLHFSIQPSYHQAKLALTRIDPATKDRQLSSYTALKVCRYRILSCLSNRFAYCIKSDLTSSRASSLTFHFDHAIWARSSQHQA